MNDLIGSNPKGFEIAHNDVLSQVIVTPNYDRDFFEDIELNIEFDNFFEYIQNQNINVVPDPINISLQMDDDSYHVFSQQYPIILELYNKENLINEGYYSLSPRHQLYLTIIISAFLTHGYLLLPVFVVELILKQPYKDYIYEIAQRLPKNNYTQRYLYLKNNAMFKDDKDVKLVAMFLSIPDKHMLNLLTKVINVFNKRENKTFLEHVLDGYINEGLVEYNEFNKTFAKLFKIYLTYTPIISEESFWTIYLNKYLDVNLLKNGIEMTLLEIL